MKTISKSKLVNFKVEWQVKVDGKDVSKESLVKGVKVQVNVPETGDIAEWFELDGETADYKPEFANHRAQVEYLVASQLLQHQGSSSFKSQALKHAKDGAEFPSGVYSHDFSKVVGERAGQVDETALRAKMGKMLGIVLDDAMWAKMQAVAKDDGGPRAMELTGVSEEEEEE